MKEGLVKPSARKGLVPPAQFCDFCKKPIKEKEVYYALCLTKEFFDGKGITVVKGEEISAFCKKCMTHTTKIKFADYLLEIYVAKKGGVL